MPNNILIAHLECEIAPSTLHSDMSQWLDLLPEKLATVEETRPDTEVAYSVVNRRNGFLTTVELYVGNSRRENVPRTDLELARLLVDHYHCRAIIPPGSDAPPYEWDLVKTDGSIVRVQEVPSTGSDDEEGVSIQEPI